ncbi:MAG: hypothetical protein ACUVWQ_08070 [Candidatus Aminicenantales bacterium]
MKRRYDSLQTSLERLFKLQATSKTVDLDKVETYQALSAQLGPFLPALVVPKKLTTTWDLTRYRPEVATKKTDSLKGLLPTEQQALKKSLKDLVSKPWSEPVKVLTS